MANYVFMNTTYEQVMSKASTILWHLRVQKIVFINIEVGQCTHFTKHTIFNCIIQCKVVWRLHQVS